jgi:hypothetical protein
MHRARRLLPEENIVNSRRRFIRILPALGLAAGLSARAAAPSEDDDPFLLPLVKETDKTALELGYVLDATRADKVKYSNYQPGQSCVSCRDFSGKPTDRAAGCILFPGRVMAAGWCNMYAKRST